MQSFVILFRPRHCKDETQQAVAPDRRERRFAPSLRRVNSDVRPHQMTPVDPSQLLAEIEDILRSAPVANRLHEPDPNTLAWLGRAASIVRRWNRVKAVVFDSEVRQLHAGRAFDPAPATAGIFTTLHEARHDLRMTAVGPLAVAVQQGAVFDYFDEVRKVIASASKELFFVDPYVDADFVSRYLTQVPASVSVRLLGKKGMPGFLPAVELLRQQSGIYVAVRTSPSLHDRYIFVDGRAEFHSGASFKDGAKNAPTTFNEVTDALSAIQMTYEDLWKLATVQK